MEREKIELVEHLDIFKVTKNGIAKRFEISAESGYTVFRKDENVLESGLMIFPAKSGIENILENLDIREVIPA